jgi:cytidyltransferase-like protein
LVSPINLDDTAVIITTFLRDDMLFRCVESVRRFYPDIAIFIGDNGTATDEKKDYCKKNHCAYFALDFDLGVSGVRNETLKIIPEKYKYLMILEDDLVFTEESKIEKLKDALEWKAENGICGCLLKLKDGREQHYEARVWSEDDVHYMEKVRKPRWFTTESGTKYCLYDLILNVFLMRREVWLDNPWDYQFKTALEHCDFFLGLQRKTKWKVAYTPDVSINHWQTMPEGYKEYRHRPVGWLLFKKKWGVNYIVSDYNNEKPLSFQAMGTGRAEDMKGANLKEAIAILNKNKATWWLEAGTCLGAVREQDFLLHDPDIDLGIHPKDIGLWEKLKQDFIDAGFKHYRDWTHKEKIYELNFRKRGVKVDLFFFYDAGDFWYHGAFGPGPDGTWDKEVEFLPHVFSANLFQDLKKITFHGLPCFIPDPAPRYLMERYGPKWTTKNTDYLFHRDCWAIDKNFFKRKKMVYIGGVWDLFHVGHLNILERCRKLGSELIVGVLTDKAASVYKTPPIMSFEDRTRIIESLKMVDRVIQQNDKDPTRDWEENKIKPHYVVHGDDWKECPGQNSIRKIGGKPVFFPYTWKISSTDIRQRLMKPPQMTTGKRSNNIAVCIKTFLRDDVLFKTIALLKKNILLPFKFYIADDGTMTDKKQYQYQQLELEGHEIILLPYNSGISIGRNSIIRQVKEDYILITDDDVVLADPLSLQNMKTVLDANDEIGLVAAVLKQENGQFFANEHYSKGLLFEFRSNLLVRLPSSGNIQNINGILYRLADQVPNIFLAKREVFNEVRWDDRIKVEYEHMDFFLNLQKTRWKAAICLNAEATHLTSNPDGEYYRYRRSAPKAYFLQKHGLANVINQF